MSGERFSIITPLCFGWRRGQKSPFEKKVTLINSLDLMPAQADFIAAALIRQYIGVFYDNFQNRLI